MTNAHVDELASSARAMLGLAREQTDALGADDLERVEQIVNERAAILERLGVGQESRATQLAAAFADAPVATQDALLAAFEELASIDLRNEATIARQLRDILDELPAMDAGRRAAAAYRASTPAAYVDTAS